MHSRKNSKYYPIYDVYFVFLYKYLYQLSNSQTTMNMWFQHFMLHAAEQELFFFFLYKNILKVHLIHVPQM